MEFDYTNGNKPRYLVSFYGGDVKDKWYYDKYRKAKEKFNEVKKRQSRGTILSLIDVVRNARKEFIIKF